MTPLIGQHTPDLTRANPEQLAQVGRAIRQALGSASSGTAIGRVFNGEEIPLDRLASIFSIARKHGLFLIEDCAQAHGATYQGKPVGGLGDAGAFSLNATRVLAGPEGGLLTTDQEAIFERAGRLRLALALARGSGLGSGSPISSAHSAIPFRASRIMRRAERSVCPWLRAPGKSTTSTTYQPSSSGS